MSLTDDINEMERRHEALVLEACELARQNQARRIEVLLATKARRWPLVLAMITGLFVGLAAAAHWFPSRWQTQVVCDDG